MPEPGGDLRTLRDEGRRFVDPPDDAPHRGISAFLVAKGRDELPPGCHGTPVDKVGYHGLTTIFEGTSEIQRRIIADQLLDDGLPA